MEREKTKAEKELEKSVKEMTDFIHGLGLETDVRMQLTKRILDYKEKLKALYREKYR